MILIARKRKEIFISHELIPIVEYEVLEGEYDYFGAVLTDKQIESLQLHHNTVIAKTLYETIGEKKLLNEVKRLTGIRCIIEIHKHDDATGDSYILKRKPKYILDTFNCVTHYVLYDHETEVRRYDKYHTLKDIKEMLKADGFTAVSIDDTGNIK